MAADSERGLSFWLCETAAFICLLMAAELYKDAKVLSGTVWATIGILFAIAGFKWTDIRKRLASRETPNAAPVPVKKPHLTIRFHDTIPLYPDLAPNILACSVSVVNDEQRFETTAHKLRAILNFEHILGDKRCTRAVWLVAEGSTRRLADEVSLGMGRLAYLLLYFWDANKVPVRYFPVDGARFMTDDSSVPPLEAGEWMISVDVTGDNAKASDKFKVTLFPSAVMMAQKLT